MSDPFADPQNDFVKIKDYVGRLALFIATEFRTVSTVNGDQDAITADVVVLDGPDAPLELKGVVIFNRWIVNALKRNVRGKPVLGVVREDATKAKRGQNAPLILEEANADQRTTARKYLETQSPFADPSA